MRGNPADFEFPGNRLGLALKEKGPSRLVLVWHGARFPGSLCLGISAALLLLSIPVVQAILFQGWESRLSRLWYFPAMNAALFGVGLFLVSLRRTLIVDADERTLKLEKKSLFGSKELSLAFAEIAMLRVGTDQVYSGARVAGSTVGESFFLVPSLRAVAGDGATVLLDRGSRRRMEALAETLGAYLRKPVAREAEGSPGAASSRRAR
jgi:hypothetical protein